MGKISGYPIITAAALNDIVIGSDVSDKNNTKNFQISQMLSLGSVLFQVDGVDNVVQNKLNLIGGDNITLTDDGLGGITIDAGPRLESNFIPNTVQNVLNLIQGNGVTITSDGTGGVTIDLAASNFNLDQTLAFGDQGINKNILLYDVSPSPQQIIVLKNNPSENLISITKISGNEFFENTISNDFLNNSQVIRSTYWPNIPSNPNLYAGVFSTERDNNGRNNLYLKKFDGSPNNFRNFEVNASYTDGNTIELSEQDAANNILANCTTTSEINSLNPTCKTIWETLDLSSNNNKVEINGGACWIAFSNTNASRGNTLQMSQTSSGGTFHTLPDWNGIIAQVNEVDRGSIDLSVVSTSISEYGMYRIGVGSNVNTLDLGPFADANPPGEFVTLLIEDTPVQLVNSAGVIFGQSTITKLGAVKLIRRRPNIYCSDLL